MAGNAAVKGRRKELRYTQGELAALARMRQSEISQIEGEGWTPPIDKQLRLAEALGVSVDSIFHAAHQIAR